MLKFISVVGARPNFIKVGAIHKALNKLRIENSKFGIEHKICHTGQHYDEKMSNIFFDELELPKPDYYLGIGSGSHAEQTANVMIEFEKVLIKEKPSLVIVLGDVNSTLACCLTAVKLGIKVAHVEAGLRSFDRTMPEEINRILTDSISNYLFVTEMSGIENLRREGIEENKLFFVGNCMIDSLINYLPKIDKSKILSMLDLSSGEYITVTMHRPSNVDVKENLEKLIFLLNSVSEIKKVVFPIHPRTKNMLEKNLLTSKLSPKLILTEPLGYLDFISLIKNSCLVITDSGGIQEETTYLDIPCVTLRKNTERPVTVEYGTNYLAGEDYDLVKQIINNIVLGITKKGIIPELWDGKTAERIVEVLTT